MRPRKHSPMGAGDLFRARLDQIINMRHELVQLAEKLDWEWLDGEIAPLYSEQGRPGIESRFVIGLLLLKHMFALSDEQVCERWVYDPYFQHFTGEEFFQHAFPHERSDLSHWRQRLGDKLELLLAESLRVAHEAGALRTKDLKRVTVDTTVQPKAISFPTDAKLLHAAIRGLARLARKHGVKLRQSYQRIAKRAAMDGGALRSCQAVQAPSSRAALVALTARPHHPRHRPQDRRAAGAGAGIRRSAVAGKPDPLAAAAPARLEALFLPRPRGRMHRQGQGPRALRVRRHISLPDLNYPFHDKAVTVTTCGRICFNRQKINLSQVFAGQTVGIKQVDEHLWLATFMHYDLGYFDDETCRLEPITNPFGPKLLPMSPE
jgi:hypothetical protein